MMTILLARRCWSFLLTSLVLAAFAGAGTLSAQDLTLNPTSLNFVASGTGATVPSQSVALGVTNGQQDNWSASTPYNYGPAPDGFPGSQNWLSVLTPSTGNPAPLNVSIGVNTANLTNGT